MADLEKYRISCPSQYSIGPCCDVLMLPAFDQRQDGQDQQPVLLEKTVSLILDPYSGSFVSLIKKWAMQIRE